MQQTENQSAIRNMFTRFGANTSRAAYAALTPIELLNPKNMIQYWLNYGNFVASRRRKRKNGKRRFDEVHDANPEHSNSEYYDEIDYAENYES